MGQASALTPSAKLVDQLDEPYIYHDTERSGFVSFLTPGAERRQVSVRLADFPEHLAQVRASGKDAYLSQNEFFKPNRRAINLKRITSCYVDLDVHKVPGMQDLGKHLMAERMLMACEDRGLPMPTVLVHSGRGLQAKWVLERPVGAGALPRWQAVQRELFLGLQSLGGDELALDASRVLRLVGTKNSRSGQAAEVVFLNRLVTRGGTQRQDGVIAYNFETLTENLLRHGRDEVARLYDEQGMLWERERLVRMGASGLKPARRSSAGRPLDAAQLAWDRLADLRRLVELRGWHVEGAPSGKRNTLVFLGACFLASSKFARNFGGEVRELAAQIAPTWTDSEVRSCVSTVLSKLEAAGRGQKIEYAGRQLDPRYRFKNETLVSLLELTAAEQAKMKCIVDRDEALRRDAERQLRKRAASGCMPRADYEARSDARAERARALRDSGLSLAEIAREMGLGRSTVGRYCAAQ